MHLGAPLGLPRRGRKPARQLVLFSGWFDLVSEASDERRLRRRWHLMALPLDMYDLLPPHVLHGGTESAYLQAVLEERGVARKVALRWPQQLGYRVVLKLAERGRIAFALMCDRRDLKRTGRMHVRKYSVRSHRIAGAELLSGLRAAGQRLTPRAARTSTEGS